MVSVLEHVGLQGLAVKDAVAPAARQKQRALLLRRSESERSRDRIAFPKNPAWR